MHRIKKYILASIHYDNQGRFRSTKLILDSEHTEKKLLAASARPEEPSVSETLEFKLWSPSNESQDIALEDLLARESVTTPENHNEESPEAKHPLLERLESLSQKRARALAKLEAHVTKSVQSYLKTGQEQKFLARVELLKAKKSALENRFKEDLFDLTFDFDEIGSEKMLEWVEKAGLSTLYKEVLDERR